MEGVPLRPSRMRIWRWMGFTVLAAVLMGFVHTVNTSPVSKEFWHRAGVHAQMARGYERDSADSFSMLHNGDNLPIEASWYYSQAQALRNQAVYHRTMERKYRIAAYFPWFSVSPDPPEPPGSAPWPTL